MLTRWSQFVPVCPTSEDIKLYIITITISRRKHKCRELVTNWVLMPSKPLVTNWVLMPSQPLVTNWVLMPSQPHRHTPSIAFRHLPPRKDIVNRCHTWSLLHRSPPVALPQGQVWFTSLVRRYTSRIVSIGQGGGGRGRGKVGGGGGGQAEWTGGRIPGGKWRMQNCSQTSPKDEKLWQPSALLGIHGGKWRMQNYSQTSPRLKDEKLWQPWVLSRGDILFLRP